MAGKNIRGLWPRTGRAWALVVAGVVTFSLLNVLVLGGSELALDLLISLSGALAGFAAARLGTYPVRRRGSGVGRIFGLFAGLAVGFLIIFGGTALAGIPPFPTAEGGNAGTMIYGLAFGFLVGVPGGLAPPGPRPASSGSEAKVVAVQKKMEAMAS